MTSPEYLALKDIEKSGGMARNKFINVHSTDIFTNFYENGIICEHGNIVFITTFGGRYLEKLEQEVNQ